MSISGVLIYFSHCTNSHVVPFWGSSIFHLCVRHLDTLLFSLKPIPTRSLPIMKTFATVFALVALVPGILGLTINTPSNIVACQPILLNWSDGTGPYYLSILPGGQPSAPAIKTFPTQTGTSLTWNVDIAANTGITIQIKDSTGATEYSDTVNVQGSSGTTCPTSSGAASGSSGATQSSSAATSSGSSGASSTLAGNAASTSRPASSTSEPSKSTSSGSTATQSASSSTKSNAASKATIGKFGVAGIVGLVGLAVL